MGNSLAKSFGDNGIKKYLYSETSYDTSNELIPSPYANTSRVTFKDSLVISFSVNYPDAKIYYYINQGQPVEYKHSITIHENTSIFTYAEDVNGKRSKTISSVYHKIPKDIKVELLSTPHLSYTGGGPEALIDQIRGGKSWRLGSWQGYQKQDFSAVIDLGKEKNVSAVTIGFLQDARSWIWMPKYVEVYSSIDNIRYNKIGTIENTVSDKDLNVSIKDFILWFDKVQNARYIKVTAVNYGKIPAWHQGAGGDAYIFVDEIIIE